MAHEIWLDRCHVVHNREPVAYQTIRKEIQREEVKEKPAITDKKTRRTIDQRTFRTVKMTGDGNCFYRAIAHFVHNDENEHQRIREELYEYIKQHPQERIRGINVKIKDWFSDEEAENIRQVARDGGDKDRFGSTTYLGVIAQMYKIAIMTVTGVCEVVGQQDWPRYYIKHTGGKLGHFDVAELDRANQEIENMWKKTRW